MSGCMCTLGPGNTNDLTSDGFPSDHISQSLRQLLVLVHAFTGGDTPKGRPAAQTFSFSRLRTPDEQPTYRSVPGFGHDVDVSTLFHPLDGSDLAEFDPHPSKTTAVTLGDISHDDTTTSRVHPRGRARTHLSFPALLLLLCSPCSPGTLQAFGLLLLERGLDRNPVLVCSTINWSEPRCDCDPRAARNRV